MRLPLQSRRRYAPKRTQTVVCIAALCALPALVAAQGSSNKLTGVDAGEHPVTVAPGDTLIGLARRFFTDPRAWREMLRSNAVRNPNLITPGQVINLPWYLMPAQQLKATVVRVEGNAQEGGSPLREGQQLGEGARIETRGEDAAAVVKLVDGTLLHLRGPGALQVERSREIAKADVKQSQVRLEQGHIDVLAAPAQRGRPGFHVNTPQGVLAVRGTEFRVAVGSGTTIGEVLEGEVHASSGGATRSVGAGFGTTLVAGAPPAAPAALLAAPDLRSWPVLREALVVRFTPPALPGAQGWRVQLTPASAAPGSEKPLATQRLAAGEIRFAALDDGEYLLRLRGIDAQGREGRDAQHRFRLKARPEAPLQTAPASDARLAGGRAELVWTQQPQAQRYRVQLAADASFAQPLREWPAVNTAQLAVDGLAPGRYHWRVGSLRDVAGSEDRGPWGSPRSFEMRALPAAPSLQTPQVGDSAVHLSWQLAPGQVAEVQLATEPTFAAPRLSQRVADTRFALPLPPPGRWYLRVRAVDADGFAGPFGTAQVIDIHACWRDASGGCVRSSDNQVLRLQ